MIKEIILQPNECTFNVKMFEGSPVLFLSGKGQKYVDGVDNNQFNKFFYNGEDDNTFEVDSRLESLKTVQSVIDFANSIGMVYDETLPMDSHSYKGPIPAKNCIFNVVKDDWSEGSVVLYIMDAKDEDDDNIRGVDYPGFDDIWDNSCENMFETDKLSLEEAMKWCLDAGMKYDEDLECGG